MSYDSSLCFLSYLDGNWLFVLPNQCQGQNCTWNVYGAPYVTSILPPSFNKPFEYQCDNKLHTLGWLDAFDEPTLQNNYLCTCGGPISITRLAIERSNGCENRCDRTWTAAFGKRCNLVTKSSKAKGNFTTSIADASQGACISVAGEGQAYPTFNGTTKPTAHTVIDGIGIANVCDGTEYNDGSGSSICTCDGQLPAEAFGRQVQNRNPCFLELDAADTAIPASPSKAWIAAPIVGGILLIALAGLLGLTLGRRRAKKQARATGDEIPMQDINTPAAPERSASQASETYSADSGVGLMAAEPSRFQEAKGPI